MPAASFPTTGRGTETRRILSLAAPVILTGLNWTILHLTDVVVVGLTGTREVAALGASRALTYIVGVTGLAWLSSVLVFTARADGAGDLRRTGGVLREGLVLGLMLGFAAMALLLAGAPALLRLIGVAPELIDESAHVTRIFALAYPFQMLTIAASFFLEGISRPSRVTLVNLAVLPINALLAWAWSGGHLGFAAAGAAGAAGATLIASMIGTAAIVVAVWTLPRAAGRGIRDRSIGSWPTLLRGAGALAKFGVMPAIASGLELAGFSILIALSTELGDTTAHAFQIVFSVHNCTFAIAMGLGSAAGVRAGNAMGEGRTVAAIRRVHIAVGLTVAATGSAGVFLAFAARPIVAMFPATPAVHVAAAAMLSIWAAFILFDGVQIVLVYALRSLGDQVATGFNSIAAYFVLTSALGLWLVRTGWGPMGLVWASGAGMVAAAALHAARFAVVSARLRQRS